MKRKAESSQSSAPLKSERKRRRTSWRMWIGGFRPIR
jgi:hypothetical protein